MSLTLGIAVYFIIWWLSLFVILPFGARSQAEADAVTPGTEPAAPVAPRLLRAALMTTVLATTIFAGFWVAYANGWLAIDSLPGFDPRRL